MRTTTGLLFFCSAALLLGIMTGCEMPEDQGIEWTYVGTSGAPAFQNGWGNFGASAQGLAYGKDSQGFLHIIGSITDSTPAQNGTVFTLPTGFRPSKMVYNGIMGADGTVYITLLVTVTNTGNVIIYSNVGTMVNSANFSDLTIFLD